MANIVDLDFLGKKLSEDFISDKVDMTASLKKIAKEHGLNKQQISRVAEVANVESYVSLMKVADDKYLNFPVADPIKVVTEINKTAEVTELSAYNNAPACNVEVSNIFSAYKKMDKTAKWSKPIKVSGKQYEILLCKEAEKIIKEKSSVEDRLTKLSQLGYIKKDEKTIPTYFNGRPINLILNEESINILKKFGFDTTKAYNELLSLGLIKEAAPSSNPLTKLSNEIDNTYKDFLENAGLAQCNIDKLYKICKQACLSGNTPSEVSTVIKLASKTLGEFLSEDIFNKLSHDAPHLDYNINFVDNVPNKESDVFKTVSEIENQIIKTAGMEIRLQELQSTYANLAKEAGLPNIYKNREISSDLVKVSGAKKILLPSLVAFLVGNKLGKEVGKEEGKAVQGRILQESMLNIGKPKAGLY